MSLPSNSEINFSILEESASTPPASNNEVMSAAEGEVLPPSWRRR